VGHHHHLHHLHHRHTLIEIHRKENEQIINKETVFLLYYPLLLNVNFVSSSFKRDIDQILYFYGFVQCLISK
jgi:hypothetical protein